MSANRLEFYANEPLPDEEVAELIELEISHAPKAPGELEERLSVHNSSSPADAGGDIDAQWEEVNTSGSESVFGHNPTPDQSIVEENARAMGVYFEDDEPLDFLTKMERRDKERYEMDPNSGTTPEML
jgi:hypothetical protein